MLQKKESSTAQICKPATTTLIKCILQNDKLELAITEKNMTIEKALAGTTLTNLSKSIGEKNTLKVVYTLILNVSNYFNVAHSMNQDQALQTATLVLDKYPVETVEDFVMIFKMAKRSELGTILHRIDGTVIFEWCARYFDLKYAKKDELRHKEVKSEKAAALEESKSMTELWKTVEAVTHVRKIKKMNRLLNRIDKGIAEIMNKKQK